ncbi:MAG: hypothetical protein EXS25_01740 [Pedosphaera sp.]|nr:hypothetical protein [Pedosphaera sp.]
MTLLRTSILSWLIGSLLCTVPLLAITETNLPPRAKVFVTSDSRATTSFLTDSAVVRRLVVSGLVAFSGKDSPSKAWRSLVRSNDIVGFKVTSAPGALIGTRIDVVDALISTLIAAGHPQSNIVIWDRDFKDLQSSGFVDLASRLGVQTAASTDLGWDSTQFYESGRSGKLVFGDLEFQSSLVLNTPKPFESLPAWNLQQKVLEPSPRDQIRLGRRSHVSLLLTRKLTRIITVAPVMNHNAAGINGHLVSLAFGAFDNVFRFDGDPNRTAESVPELCALDDLMPKVIFGVSDALLAQVQGEKTARLHETLAINEIRFSVDLVALDSLALADIEAARSKLLLDGEKPFKTELYGNAELLNLGVADPRRIDVIRVP